MPHQTEPTTQKSRKHRHCDWCWERIAIGDEYKRYRVFNGGDASTVQLHPECYEAMSQAAHEEGGWYEWTAGMERPKVAV